MQSSCVVSDCRNADIYMCSNSMCVHSSLLCDHQQHCSTGEDEIIQACVYRQLLIDNGQFKTINVIDIRTPTDLPPECKVVGYGYNARNLEHAVECIYTSEDVSTIRTSTLLLHLLAITAIVSYLQYDTHVVSLYF